MQVGRKTWLAAGCALTIVSGAILATVAVAQSGSDTFSACARSSGQIRAGTITLNGTPTCKPNQTVVTWNAEGPQGMVGPQGPTGPEGPAGTEGQVGPAGPAGTTEVYQFLDHEAGPGFQRRTLDVAAGSYVVTISAAYEGVALPAGNNPGPEPVVTCELIFNSPAGPSLFAFSTSIPWPNSLDSLAPHTASFTVAGRTDGGIDFECVEEGGHPAGASFYVVTAVGVDDIVVLDG